MGVLNAAASAAEQPTGDKAFTVSVLSWKRRPSTDAMPAPSCTDGPSRPSAMPPASEMEQQMNFLIATGHTGQTTEVLALPGETEAFERVTGVRIPSYATVSVTYHFHR